MFVQTQITPNPNSLKFLQGKTVSNSGSYEVTKKEDINNDLVRNILSINGVMGVFLGKDFISVNKDQSIDWEDIKLSLTRARILLLFEAYPIFSIMNKSRAIEALISQE